MPDKSDYDRSRYDRGRVRRYEEGRAERLSHQTYRNRRQRAEGDLPRASESLSRDNAKLRYAQRERHLSTGRSVFSHDGREESTSRGARSQSTSHGGSGATRAAAARGSADRRSRRPVKVLAAVVAVLLFATVLWYANLASSMKPSADVSGVTTPPKAGQPYYCLLLGSDSRAEKDDVARADSIMLARVDESAKQVTLVSLPRDLRVEVEGHGMGKLNSALAYNGFPGAVKAASEVAGVPISYYAVIYFSGFEGLVDQLGGVEVEVPEGTYYDGVTVPAGKHSKIDGKEALVLARCRHGNPPDQGAYAAGDYQRTLNQRNLIKAIARKTLDQPFFKLPGSISTVATCVETNMPAHKIAFLMMRMRGMDTEGIYSATVPSHPEMIDGVSYIIADEEEWAAMMRRVDAGEDPNG